MAVRSTQDVNGNTNDTPEYYFDRDFLASARLNLQHYLWGEALGYFLHPRIPIPTFSSHSPNGQFRVADLGTGTGIWLHSLSLTLPASACFAGVGLDISPAQFPHPGLSPSHLTFRQHDCSQEAPQDLRGTFDVIHLRLLQMIVEGNDPSAFTRTANQLLKPGGWIQWDEYENTSRRIEAYGSGGTEMNKEIAKRTTKHKPMEWISRLDQILRDSGFEQVELSRRRADPYLQKALTEMVLVSHIENAKVNDRTGGDGDSIRQAVDGSAKELGEGTVTSHLLQVVVGRKKIGAEEVHVHGSK